MTLAGVANPIQNYEYDSLYRLTEAEETAGAVQNWIQQFQYDRFGNRIAFSQTLNKTSGAVQTTATPVIDPLTNRFVTTNQNFRYDKNGNLTTDGDNRDVIFNGENRQYEVKNASGQTIGRYFFYGEGKRVKKITWNSQGASETTIFVYSAGKLVAEYSDTQVPVPNKTTRYLTEDHLGTPRVLTDSQGKVISRRDFLPFGEEITPDIGARASVAAYQPTTDNVKQKFTGYQKDEESGLDFAEARMYENRHGRFTAVDPLLASGKSGNPQTFNRFVYVGNSPLVLTDPSGTDWYYNPYIKTYRWFDVDPDDPGWNRLNGYSSTFACFCLYDGKLMHAAFNPLANIVTPNLESAAVANHFYDLEKAILRGRDFTDGMSDAVNPIGTLTRKGLNYFGFGRDANSTSPDYVLGDLTGRIAATVISSPSFFSQTPVNGIINIGGKGEYWLPASNVNIMEDATGAGIKLTRDAIARTGGELIIADGSRIGRLFDPGSASLVYARKIIGSKFNWQELANGAHKVLKPGGKVDMNVWTHPDQIAQIRQAFINAGFRAEEVTVQGSGSGTLIRAIR